MFGRKPTTPSELDQAITNVHEHLTDYPPESEEYAAMADQLVKLYPLRSTTAAPRVSPDAVVSAVGNLLGIIVIVEWERVAMVTSKALQFANKLKT